MIGKRTCLIFFHFFLTSTYFRYCSYIDVFFIKSFIHSETSFLSISLSWVNQHFVELDSNFTRRVVT